MNQENFLSLANKILFGKIKVFFLFLLIGLIAPFFIFQKIQAADAAPPFLGHWGIMQIDGDASATTTISVFAMSGDDLASPGGSPNLTMTAFYKNATWTGWAQTTCAAQYGISNLFRCNMGVKGSATDARNFQYYLRAHDTVNYTFSSLASNTNSTTSAQASPYSATVYNTPSWTNNISGAYTTSFKAAGVKDGRCTSLATTAVAGTNIVEVARAVAITNGLANTQNEWIAIGSEKFKIISTSTVSSNMRIVLSGNLVSAAVSGVCINKFISNALIRINGTTFFASSSAVSATSTFGTFNIYNIPNGNWEVTAFKTGFMEAMQSGVSLFGNATTTLSLMMPQGNFGGGGDMTGGNVIWSAPSDKMNGAPIDIAIDKQPILIGLSENASSTTITTSNVLLKKVNSSGVATAVSGYSVAYKPKNGSVTINSVSYDFGPDAKIIIYSATKLDVSSSYVVRLTSDIRDSAGNALVGNDPEGGHTISFGTSGGDFSGGFSAGNFGGGGAYMPPYVKNMAPRPGSKNNPLNAKIVLQFSQPMTSTVANQDAYIQVWKLDSGFNLSTQAATTPASARTSSEIIIVTPDSNLTQGTYRILVKGGLQSSSSMTMGPPGSETTIVFQSDFEVGSAADTGLPTVLATSLDRYKNTVGSYVSVPTATLLKISFSETINPDYVNVNTVTLKVKGASTNLTASAQYDIAEGKALLMPASALNSTTTYILSLFSGIKDLTKAENYLATTTYEFTTGSMDVQSPQLEFFNADDYTISLTFSESMNNSPSTYTNLWPSGKSKWYTSVLNSANYVVYVDNGAPPSGSIAKYFACDNLAGTTTACTTSGVTGLTFSYDVLTNSVKISGLKMRDPLVGLSGVGGVRIWVNNVTDIAGNEILDSNAIVPPNNFGRNSRGGPILNSANTSGMMGPGGGMMGPPTSIGSFTITDFGGKDPAMMGMNPVNVMPMNNLAGASSVYMINIPVSVSKTISAGGKIVLGPFPDESNVSGAKNADVNSQFAHYDINGPGPGKVVLGTASENTGGLANDGVTVTGQVVTVTLGTSVGTGAPDFLHLELSGILNPTTPTQGGYKLSIQTQDSSGRLLESMTSMPFFIKPKGKYTLVGRVKTGATGLNGVNLFGGSPSTGPLSALTVNNAFGSSTDGEFKIEGLSSGEMMLMLEPYIEVSGTEYIAPMGQPIFLDDATTANNSGGSAAGATGCTSQTACYLYKLFSLTPVSVAGTPALTVKIYGNFSSGGVGATDLDIFAGGQSGFRVKSVNLSSDYSSTPYSATLNLPAIGDYNVGIGPAMPKGPMGMAGAPMPTGWMPPKNENVRVAGAGGTWTWSESSATPNDGIAQFTIGVAGKTITGYVKDNNNVVVSNAEIFAYSPTGFFGTNSHAKQDGSFTLYVKEGMMYKVGAFLPGAPPSGEVAVDVKTDGSVYVDGVLTSSLILKISKSIQSGYTISGTVYSDSGSNYPSSDASVYAYRTDGPGHSETMTDSLGTYTIYVSTGTWKVGAYLSDYGNLTEQTIVVPPSKSSLNFAPSADITYITVRERVWEDKNNNNSFDAGEGISGARVAFVSTSTDYVNSASTDSAGLYEVKLAPSTVYDIETWSPDIGSLPPQKNLHTTTTDIIYTSFSGFADVPTEYATTVAFVFYDANGNATSVAKVLVQLDQMGVAGVSNDVYKENVTSATLKVSTSTTSYLMDVRVQGVPKELLTFTPTNTAVTTMATSTVGGKLFATAVVNGAESIKVILPKLCYVSGQVLDGDGVAVGGAMVHVEQPGKDIEFDTEADSSGIYSFRVASSTTPYLVQAVKSGYLDTSVSVYASTTNVTFNPLTTKTNRAISGVVTLNGSAPNENIYVWAERLGGGYVSSAQGDTATGAYSLSVYDGDWDVYATVEGYSSASKTTIVHVSSANVTGVNFDVSASVLSSLNKQQALGMTGNVGGSLMNKDANFEMNVPMSTISASDSSSYNVKEKEISNIPTFTSTADLVGGKAEEVSAYKMSGSSGGVSTVSSLNGSAFVDKIYTKAELAAEGIDTVAEIEQTKMSSYTDNNWVALPTTITYLDSNDKPVVPLANLSNVNEVVFNGATKHFSTFGVINTVYDGLPPAVPVDVSIQGSTTGITVSWSAVSTNVDGTTASDIIRYNVWRAISNSDSAVWTKIGSVNLGTNSYADTSGQRDITYYYRVTADSGLQSGFSGVSSGATYGSISGGYSGSSNTGGGGGGGGSDTPVVQSTATTTVVTTTATSTTIATSAQTTATQTTALSLPVITFEKPISQMTKAEIEAKIIQIFEAIKILQQMLAQTQPTPSLASIPTDFKFSQNLRYGASNAEVKYLQIVLNTASDTRVAEAGNGSPGKETSNFGRLTEKAVIKFQEKYKATVLQPFGLNAGTGIVAPKTRAKLNEILGNK